jgi:hypothetical protein
MFENIFVATPFEGLLIGLVANIVAHVIITTYYTYRVPHNPAV